MKRCVAPLCAVALLTGPTYVDAKQVSETTVRLGFDVEAEIMPRCGFDRADVSAQIASLLTNAMAGETRTAQFNLSCNSPFTVRVQSRNGGLAAEIADPYEAQLARDVGLATKLDYAVTLDVPIVDMAGNRVVSQTVCDTAADMRGGAANCALAQGEGVRFEGTSDTGQAKLTVKLEKPSLMPVAGAYTDYLTIDVGFAL